MPLPYRNLTANVTSTSPRALSNDVANAPKKEPLEFLDGRSSQGEASGGDEVDHISQRLSELQGELFLSLKEDIAEWIIKTLGDEVKIDVDNFVYALDTGVILCQISMAIEEKAREAKRQGLIKEQLPDFKLHCNKSAKSGTWFARDNTANFLRWCRAYGMTDESLFDSEDLVAHHQERQVIYCLMEIARLGARFGLEPPSLITMEKEIDSQVPSPREATPPPPPPPAQELPTPHESPPPTPPPVEETPPQTAPTTPRKAPTTSSSKGSTASTLDGEVKRVSTRCKCQQYVNKLSEGVYDVFGRRVFIRLLKGKHLMVRVGGGWDTFENYLLHHDPIQVFEFHQGGHAPGHTLSAHGAVHSHSFAVARNDFKPGGVLTPQPSVTSYRGVGQPRDRRVKFSMMGFLLRMRTRASNKL